MQLKLAARAAKATGWWGDAAGEQRIWGAVSGVFGGAIWGATEIQGSGF